MLLYRQQHPEHHHLSLMIFVSFLLSRQVQHLPILLFLQKHKPLGPTNCELVQMLFLLLSIHLSREMCLTMCHFSYTHNFQSEFNFIKSTFEMSNVIFSFSIILFALVFNLPGLNHALKQASLFQKLYFSFHFAFELCHKSKWIIVSVWFVYGCPFEGIFNKG